MKLPGIEYKQRGPLARIDPSSYLAVGQAQARASKAVGEVAGNIYEQESVSEMQDAYLNYTEQMDIWSDQQQAYSADPSTGESEGSWVSGSQKYEDNERTLRDTINQKLKTPLARRLFNEKANQLNVRNKAGYRGQLQQWKKEHEVAGVYTRLNRQLDSKKFQDARDTLVESYTVGTISENDAAKQLIKVNYQEKYYGYSLAVDVLETPEDAIKYRKKISGTSLEDSDKNKITAAIDSKYINAHRITMNEVITEAESINENKAEGYAAGVKHFEELMRKDPNELGGDAHFKEQVLSTAHTILNRYKPSVVKQTSEQKRYRNADDYNSGRRIAGTKFNAQSHDDSFSFSVLNFRPEGKADFKRDFNNPDPSLRGLTDQEILDNKNSAIDRFVEFSGRTGYMPKYMKDMFNAALTHNNAEYGAKATEASYRLMQENPYALWRDGENNDLTQVATLSEMMGGTPEAFSQSFSLWKQSQGISDDQRTALLGSKKDRDKYFDDNFNSLLEKQYGDRGTAFFNFWTTTTPEVKQQYKVLARTMMDKYTVINKGNFERGLQSAVISMKGSYHPTTVNGDYTIMKNAPEVAVQDGDKNGGAWLAEQLKSDIHKNYGEDVDMTNVNVEPVDKWNPDDPAYKVYLTDDSGMRRMLGVTKFDYTLSGEYKSAEEELKKLEAANRSIAKTAKLRAEWDIEHPPATRERDRTGIEVNPYGVAPSQSAVGKSYTKFGRGLRAMGEAAKVGQAQAKEIRKKTDIEKSIKRREIAERYTGPGSGK